MVDLNEHTMMFTLNGEVLLDDSGSELAFKDFEVVEGQCCVIELETQVLTLHYFSALNNNEDYKVNHQRIPGILKNSLNLLGSLVNPLTQES